MSAIIIADAVITVSPIPRQLDFEKIELLFLTDRNHKLQFLIVLTEDWMKEYSWIYLIIIMFTIYAYLRNYEVMMFCYISVLRRWLFHLFAIIQFYEKMLSNSVFQRFVRAKRCLRAWMILISLLSSFHYCRNRIWNWGYYIDVFEMTYIDLYNCGVIYCSTFQGNSLLL